METLFYRVRETQQFRTEFAMFMRRNHHMKYTNVDALEIERYPYKKAGPNEILLRFGDIPITCVLTASGEASFR